MKNTYKKHLLLQGNSLSPTASENYPAKSKLTHFSEHSQISFKNQEFLFVTFQFINDLIL